MDPILADIYSTILPSMPFVIGAYALIWIVLFVYVVFIVRGTKKTEREIIVLEETLKAQGLMREDISDN